MAQLNRRNFLRGFSAAVALPAMTSLGPRSLMAATDTAVAGTTASGAPLRTAFIHFPNGAIPNAWWPDSDHGKFQLSQTLSPLESVKDSLQVLKGLDLDPAVGGPDGAGDHARGNGTFLTGVRLNKSPTNIRAGISIDQVIASSVGEQTRFRSLELTCDNNRNSGECDSGYSCAYQYNMAWRSPTTPMIPESNPRLVFERLFGSGGPSERTANFQQRQSQQKSVLDFVLSDARRMRRRLQQTDRQKLDEYLTAVRSIETRIEKSERLKTPDVSDKLTPDGIPDTHSQHIALMFDLLRLAFQTDSTRVATFSFGHDGSNRSFKEIGIVEGHHELSHHQNKEDRIEKVSRIDMFYTQQLARFLSDLQDTKDTDGNSLLHNSMIVYGSGNADGNRHTHKTCQCCWRGMEEGNWSPGRLVDHRSQPLTNLYLSMADRMGVKEIEQFGDSNGRLKDV